MRADGRGVEGSRGEGGGVGGGGAVGQLAAPSHRLAAQGRYRRRLFALGTAGMQTIRREGPPEQRRPRRVRLRRLGPGERLLVGGETETVARRVGLGGVGGARLVSQGHGQGTGRPGGGHGQWGGGGRPRQRREWNVTDRLSSGGGVQVFCLNMELVMLVVVQAVEGGGPGGGRGSVCTSRGAGGRRITGFGR